MPGRHRVATHRRRAGLSVLVVDGRRRGRGAPETDQDLEWREPQLQVQERDRRWRRRFEGEGRPGATARGAQAPDSFQGHAGAELRDYIQAKQIVPIDFIYQKYGFKKVMSKQLVSQITYKGHIYSVPVNIHRANVLWYNPSVLRKAGITAAPKTWNEFIAAPDKAKAADVIPLALAEQWTAVHLLETVMIATIGPTRWAGPGKRAPTGRTRASRSRSTATRRCSRTRTRMQPR